MYVAEAAAPFARLAILILWMNSGDVLGECAVLRVYLSNPPSHEETITFLCWVLVFLLTAPHTIALLRRTSYFRSFSRSHACVEYQLTYTLLFWQEDTLSPVAGHEHKGWLVAGFHRCSRALCTSMHALICMPDSLAMIQIRGNTR